MADYYSVLSRAIESLRPNTAETRRVLYERAEQTLLAQLRALDPPASEDQIQAQTKSLTDAIARIEAEHAVTEALSVPEPVLSEAAKTDQEPETDRAAADVPDKDDGSPSEAVAADASAETPDMSAPSGDTSDTKDETPSVTPPPPSPASPPRASSLPDPARLEVRRTPTFGAPVATPDDEDVSPVQDEPVKSDQPDKSEEPDKAPLLSGVRRTDSPFPAPPRLSTEPKGLSVSAEDRTIRTEGERVEPSLRGGATPSLGGTDAFARSTGRAGPLAGDARPPEIGQPTIGQPRISEPRIGDGQRDAPKADEKATGAVGTGEGSAGPSTAAGDVSGATSDGAPSQDPFVDQTSGRRRGRGIGLVLVLLIVVGVIGAGVYWFRGPILEWSDAILEMISAPSTEDASDKIEDRLTEEGGETPADDATDPADTAGDTTRPDTGATPTAPDVLDTGVAEAQLIEQNEEEPNRPDRTPGTVRWQTEGTGDQLELVGSVDVPGRGLAMSMRFAKNTDETFPATHTIIFQFSLSPEFEHGGVQDVPRLLLKQTAQSSGNALVTDVIPLGENAFLMALSGVDLDSERNLTELRTRPFLDVPLIYADGRLAILTIAKGAQGDRAFADAFAAWGQ